MLLLFFAMKKLLLLFLNVVELLTFYSFWILNN